jgi:hypothetical protein
MFMTRCMENAGRRRRRDLDICLVLALWTLISSAGAGNLDDLEISEQSGLYRVKVVMLLHAPANYVHRVLTDYVHIYRLNPSITESSILPSPVKGAVRVKTRVQGCLFFFCRDIDRVEEVRELEAGHLRAVIVPEQSDFASGQADWLVRPVGADSEVHYESQFTPAFFIPPIIGSYFLRQAIGESIMASLARIECIARINARMATRPWQYLADSSADALEVVEPHTALPAGEDPSAHGDATAAGGYDRYNDSCYRSCEQDASAC